MKKWHSGKLVSSVTRDIVFMVIAKMIIEVVTDLADHLPGFNESRRNVSKNKRVNEFEIRHSGEVSKRKNRELLEERFSMIIIFLVGNYSTVIVDFCLVIRGCKREGDAEDQISIALIRWQ
jgi:hypothetical protein